MDAVALAQFIRIVGIAVLFLIAAPIVVVLAEGSDRRDEREHARRERPWEYAHP
jgi:hypothetical protein